MSKTASNETRPVQTAAPSARRRGDGWLVLALMAVVAAAGVIAYWPALSATALRKFDVVSVSSPTLRNPSAVNAARSFTHSVRGLYQPLPIVSLMADTAAGGTPTEIRPYHRTSLGLHALNAALMVWLLYLLFGSPWAAALAGLLFALHPLAVEPLVAVMQRTVILATTFSLLSLIAYTRYAQRAGWWRYLAAFLAMTGALLCEPITITLPLIMLLLDWWPLRRLAPETILEKVPAILLAAAAGAVFVLHPGVKAVGLPASRMPLIAAHDLIFYLGKTFWPAKLSPYYAPPEPLALASGSILAAVIGSVVLLALAIVLARRVPALLAGIAIFVLAMLPSVQMMRFSDTMAANRFAYLPLLGLTVIAAALLARIFRGRAGGRILAACLVLVLATAEGVAARRQITNWRDTETLVRRMTALAPGSVDLHAELAEVLIANGKHKDGIEELRTVCKLLPDSASAQHRLGLALAQQKDFAGASEAFTRALQIKPDLAPVYGDLGQMLTEMHRFQDAADVLVRLADIRPWDSKAQYNVGVALQQLGKTDEAVARYRKAVEADAKNVDARQNLGMCLLEQGEKDKALEQFQEAARLRPDLSRVHSNLGGLLREIGKLEESEVECREAVRLEPQNAKWHLNLALTLEAREKLEEATQELRRAVELNPQSPEAHFLLGNVLNRRQMGQEAIKAYAAALHVAPDFAPARAALRAATSQEAPQQ